MHRYLEKLNNAILEYTADTWICECEWDMHLACHNKKILDVVLDTIDWCVRHALGQFFKKMGQNYFMIEL